MSLGIIIIPTVTSSLIPVAGMGRSQLLTFSLKTGHVLQILFMLSNFASYSGSVNGIVSWVL